MSLFQVNKPKSAAKLMVSEPKQLADIVLGTLAECSQIVGATLGPGGKQVLIERAEIGMRPIITKDGVTVMKNLGFDKAEHQLVLESVRDAAIRTASEAGDGTSTSVILSHAIAEQTYIETSNGSKFSPQKIVRAMSSLFPVIEKEIKLHCIDASDRDTLMKVATLSANGDEELANAVLESLDAVGDEGNITIIEQIAPSGYSIDRIHGYTIEQGYENSCRNMANGFLNDKTGTKIILTEAPIVLLYDGMINDLSQILEGATKIDQYIAEKGIGRCEVLLVAHGFSDAVVGDLHVNWHHPHTKVKVVPLLSPESFIKNSRTQMLYDLQAYVGLPVFNPIEKSIVDMDVEAIFKNNRTLSIEVDRFKANIIAKEDECAINLRVEELKERNKTPESEYEQHELNIRIGKLTSGIARLTISAPSQGETREKRDRAEDAWMAVRGAIQHGACPGGGYVLIQLSRELHIKAKISQGAEKVACQILERAFTQPVHRLFENYGFNSDETQNIINGILAEDLCYDIHKGDWVGKSCLLDSAPAVIESIRNSISIAGLLGSLGGIIAFKRDQSSDKEEEKFVRKYEETTGTRGSVDA